MRSVRRYSELDDDPDEIIQGTRKSECSKIFMSVTNLLPLNNLRRVGIALGISLTKMSMTLTQHDNKKRKWV
jgi:hypothetical protein